MQISPSRNGYSPGADAALSKNRGGLQIEAQIRDHNAIKLENAIERELARLLPSGIHSRVLPAREVDFTSPKTKRQDEFKAGRKLTAQLLARLDREEPVGVSDDRSPVWPPGITGSISHSSNWLWSTVAQKTEFESVGIDTEPVVDEPTRIQLINEIASPREWQIAGEAGLDKRRTFTLVFSAKESLYKCLYPRTREFFGFNQAEIIEVDESRLRLELTPDNPNIGLAPDRIDVSYGLNGNDIFTAAWLKA